MLLQSRCIIINPVLNVANKNNENNILKKLKDKNKDDEKTSIGIWFNEQSYSLNSLNKVIHYIKQTENENPGRIFEMKQSENTYIEILKSYEYFIESHISRIGDVLKDKLPGIECWQKTCTVF